MSLEPMNEVSIEPARDSDRSEIRNLLTAAGLEDAGLDDHLATTLLAWRGPRLVGCAALELYDGSALMRSVAVHPADQGKGLGLCLVDAMLDLARQYDINQVYLLTDTANGFFRKFGFDAIDLSHVPADVKQSSEFSMACAQSALVMKVTLPVEHRPEG
ncbi:MAG: GNAT family N-acetyltransferase [Fidelibacterota bacterium]|nr:MAG: GNAT family N-acetyltransferase [Candidatus Neomarinimicrobiota bacterium]